MIRESFIEKLKEVEKERDKEKEGRVNAEEELKRTKKMLEEVRKVLDDERRGREAADEPEMPEEGQRKPLLRRIHHQRSGSRWRISMMTKSENG